MPGYMKVESRDLLDFIGQQPERATNLSVLRAAFPLLADSMAGRVSNLVTGGYLARDQAFGVPTRYVLQKEAPERTKRSSVPPRKQPVKTAPVIVDALPPAAPYVGQVVPVPTHDRGAPWPEPYLTEVGVRRDGLDYRDCPSRRGDRLVYCYRRETR